MTIVERGETDILEAVIGEPKPRKSVKADLLSLQTIIFDMNTNSSQLPYIFAIPLLIGIGKARISGHYFAGVVFNIIMLSTLFFKYHSENIFSVG